MTTERIEAARSALVARVLREYPRPIEDGEPSTNDLLTEFEAAAREAAGWGAMLRKFEAAAGGPSGRTPQGWLSSDERELRSALRDEEDAEYEEAIGSGDIVLIAKELADSIYVRLGDATYYGIDIDAVFAEVHRSNMTKTIGVVVEQGGKVSKDNPHYEPADVIGVLGAQR